MLVPGETITIAVSGGKDSTVLLHVIYYIIMYLLNKVLKMLNDKYNYGVKLHLLAINEGICGYRDKSLESVQENAK